MSAAADATLAARLCAADPKLGGLVLRGGSDDAREAAIAAVADGRPVRRLPVAIDDGRLTGCLDLAATLATGTMVKQRGLLAEAEGGVIVVPMAERMAEATASHVAAALDGGIDLTLVLLDDGIEPDERPPAALMERVAFHFEFAATPPVIPALSRDPAQQMDARGNALRATARVGRSAGSRLKAGMTLEGVEAVAATTLALGIDSARAGQFALRAARAAAVLAGRTEVAEEDLDRKSVV